MEVDLSMSAHANARRMYGHKKVARAKEEKTIMHSEKALQQVPITLHHDSPSIRTAVPSPLALTFPITLTSAYSSVRLFSPLLPFPSTYPLPLLTPSIILPLTSAYPSYLSLFIILISTPLLSSLLDQVEEQTTKSLEAQKIKRNLQAMRKVHWFEKFNWFLTSEGYLVLSGRDAHQNEALVKRYWYSYLHPSIFPLLPYYTLPPPSPEAIYVVIPYPPTDALIPSYCDVMMSISQISQPR